MSSQLFNPTSLLNHLQARSGQKVKSFAAVLAVVAHVYQCSLYKEESREVRCRVIIVREPADHIHLNLLRFATPVPLSVAILRRLSFATEPDNALVVDCAKREPLVIGCATPTALMAYFDVLGIQQRPYEVACFAPGVVELSAYGRTVRFARDKYVIPELHWAVPCAIPPTSVTSMVQRVVFPGIYGWINYSMGRSVGITDPTSFALHHETFQAEALWPAKWALNHYAIMLAMEIRAIGIGGSVLILPFLDGSEMEALMSGYVVAAPHERYRGELWNAGVLNKFEWLLHLRMAYLEKMVISMRDKSQTAKEWIASEGRAGSIEASEIAEVDAKRVAKLSAIDGALVVNCLFSPVIFGAKFKKVDINALPQPIQDALATSGMRHRSMAVTVAAIPESGGIVVSQDGDVTVFSNLANVVCCHHEEAEVGSTVSPACGHAGRRDTMTLPDWLMDVFSGGQASERH